MTPIEPVPALPAATVLLLHDGTDGLEVLLLRRSSELAFHGGAWVFPGGRVDEADRDPMDPGDSLAAARRAAAREALEEARVGITPEELVVVSHWTTPLVRPKRFATWFFAAAVNARQCEVIVDGSEIHDHAWMRPSDALAAQARGEIELPPPTFVTLVELARYATAAEALAAFEARTPPVFTPRLHTVAGGIMSLYEGDAGYDDGDLERPGPRRRLYSGRTGWRYEEGNGGR